MGQSLTKSLMHIVFTTKLRKPLIDFQIEDKLYNYIAGICDGCSSHAIQVGGYINHVHILCDLSKNMSLSQLLKNIKQDSSRWIKTIDDRYQNFYWQNGYGAFSVQYNNSQKVIEYIRNQHVHHQSESLENELKKMCESGGLQMIEEYFYK